jgi:hypothetical protein
MLAAAENCFLAQVEFGECIKAVGNENIFGSWQADKAVNLKWHDGDCWKTTLNIPIGKSLKFKVGK